MSYLPPNTGENYEVVFRGDKYIWVRKMNKQKIYIFVAKNNYVPSRFSILPMTIPVVCGRAAAQAAHAIAALQFKMRVPLANITTLIMQVSNEEALRKIMAEADRYNIQYAEFEDSMAEGEPRFLTAVALAPLVPEEVMPLLEMMPLWSCK